MFRIACVVSLLAVPATSQVANPPVAPDPGGGRSAPAVHGTAVVDPVGPAAGPQEGGGPEVIGPWTISQTPSSASAMPVGGLWDWLNVVDIETTVHEAFTGFSVIDDGFANADAGTTLDLTFAGGVVNGAGPDLVVFEAAFDFGPYEVSTDFDGFASSVSLSNDAFDDTGEDRDYFYGFNPAGPFLASILAAPVDLSDLGVPPGSTVHRVRLTMTSDGSDPIGLGAIEPAECLLVIGDSPGNVDFLGLDHVFTTLLDDVADSHYVLMEAIPEFVLPASSLAAAGQAQGLRTSTSGDADVPAWMADGEFTVQILMWNPSAFPQQPEGVSHGLHVRLLPGGAVVTTPYGSGSGIEVWAETSIDEQGRSVVRFPFLIPGL